MEANWNSITVPLKWHDGSVIGQAKVFPDGTIQAKVNETATEAIAAVTSDALRGLSVGFEPALSLDAVIYTN